MINTYLAFFDVDGTVIDTKSMFSFLKYYWQNIPSNIGASVNFKYYAYLIKVIILQKLGCSRQHINEKYYQHFAGKNKDEIMLLGKMWWERISASKLVYNHKVINEIRFHQQSGAAVVLVSGSMEACVNPIAEELGIRHCLVTSLENNNGIYTGKINGIPNIGNGKVKKIKEFIEKNYKDVDLSKCFAYGDHESDISMLEYVGNPVVVGKNEFLIKIAKKSGWKIFGL